MLETPVLFLIFNRPALTAQVFKRIRAARPRQLFVAADGPRPNNLKDKALCMETRKIIEQIDWACEVKTLFRVENLGCGKAVSEAITWFFDHVEEGIILEDDCVPHADFFLFCEKMLEKYRHEARIMQITGTNYLFKQYKNTPNTYHFSAYNSIWGWATWRKSWQQYRFYIEQPSEILPHLTENITHPVLRTWLMESFTDVAAGKIDTWDFQWNFAIQKNNGLCVTPNLNLIKNKGYFGVHYMGRTLHNNMLTYSFNVKNIIHPTIIEIDREKDFLAATHMLYSKKDLRIRIAFKIREMLKKYLNVSFKFF